MLPHEMMIQKLLHPPYQSFKLTEYYSWSCCCHAVFQKLHSKMSVPRILFLTRYALSYALFLFKDTVPKALLNLNEYTHTIQFLNRDKRSTATDGTTYLLSYLATSFAMLKHELKCLGGSRCRNLNVQIVYGLFRYWCPTVNQCWWRSWP